jgi:hypothetical protein
MAEQLFVALYTDADVTPKLAKLLRERDFNAVSAHEVGNAELEDSEHLAYAASQGRAILTYNTKDYYLNVSKIRPPRSPVEPRLMQTTSVFAVNPCRARSIQDLGGLGDFLTY